MTLSVNMTKKINNNKVEEVKYDDKEFTDLLEKVKGGVEISSTDLTIILQKASHDIHEYISSGKKSPIPYLSDKINLSTSALNSYFFTTYSVFQRDLKDKINPYVAFTLAIIHAVNLGYLLGQMRNGNSTNTSKGESGSSDTIVTA